MIYKYKTNEKNFFFFIYYFVDPPFDNLKYSARHTINYSFGNWTEGIFSHASKIVFLSSKIVEYCRPPS